MSAVRRSARALAAGAMLAAALALALAGCGSSKPKPAELGPPVALLPVHQAWHAQLGSVAGGGGGRRPLRFWHPKAAR